MRLVGDGAHVRNRRHERIAIELQEARCGKLGRDRTQRLRHLLKRRDDDRRFRFAQQLENRLIVGGIVRENRPHRDGEVAPDPVHACDHAVDHPVVAGGLRVDEGDQRRLGTEGTVRTGRPRRNARQLGDERAARKPALHLRQVFSRARAFRRAPRPRPSGPAGANTRGSRRSSPSNGTGRRRARARSRACRSSC